MGSLYDRYKTEQGWVEIEIKEDSMFWGVFVSG